MPPSIWSPSWPSGTNWHDFSCSGPIDPKRFEAAAILCQTMIQGLQLRQHCHELALAALTTTRNRGLSRCPFAERVPCRDLGSHAVSPHRGQSAVHGEFAGALDGARLAIPTAWGMDPPARLGGHRSGNPSHLAGVGHTAASSAQPHRAAAPRSGQCVRVGVLGGLSGGRPGDGGG